MTINLTTFVDNASALGVMERTGRESHSAGTAHEFFGARLALVQVGDSQGEDTTRGAYDWFPLTINGAIVGELRDDAGGMTIHVDADAPAVLPHDR